MNLAHLQLFVARLKKAQATNQRAITLTIAEATALHADITSLLIHTQKEEPTPPARVDFSGGDF